MEIWWGHVVLGYVLCVRVCVVAYMCLNYPYQERHKTLHPNKCGLHNKYRGEAGKKSNGANMEEQERKMTSLLANMEDETE